MMSASEFETLKAEVAAAVHASRERAFWFGLEEEDETTENATDDGEACTCARCTEELPV